MGHMVDGEGAFEPVRRQLPARKYIAGIVDEHIDARLDRSNLLADPLHFREKRQVGIMRPVGEVGADLTQLREGGVRPLAAPCHQNDPRPQRGKPCGGDISDARSGTGDDDDLAVNGGLLRSRCRDFLHQFFGRVQGCWLHLYLSPLAARGRPHPSLPRLRGREGWGRVTGPFRESELVERPALPRPSSRKRGEGAEGSRLL